MCLAIPMRLIEIDGVTAVAEVDGVTRAGPPGSAALRWSWGTTS